ncbi:MAG: FkbM family methyltransferase [Alphaproteobacteria bacterium]|nr:FkbM family methyltransferase [Alphaproteobacteria bacterium]
MTVAANGLTGAVTIVPCAVSNQSGRLRMKTSRNNAGDHQLLNGNELSGDETFEVDVVTLDQVIADANCAGSDIGLIFMDIQGHEPEALEGAPKLLETAAPIVMEFTPRAMAKDGKLERLLRVLADRYDTFATLGIEGVSAPAALGDLRTLRIGDQEHLDLFVFCRPQ